MTLLAQLAPWVALASIVALCALVGIATAWAEYKTRRLLAPRCEVCGRTLRAPRTCPCWAGEGWELDELRIWARRNMPVAPVPGLLLGWARLAVPVEEV